MADLPTPVLVIAGLAFAAWLGLIVRVVVGAAARRRLEEADVVTAGGARARDGDVVAVRGRIAVAPTGLIRAPRTGEVWVHARYRVSRSVDHVQEVDGDRRMVTDTDVEEEVEVPADDPVIEVADRHDDRIRVRARDLEDLPAERVLSDTTQLPRPTGARSAVRTVTEDVVRDGTPVVLRGRVEVVDGVVWLRPSLGEPVGVQR